MSIQHRLQTKERITAIIGIGLLGLIAGASYWYSTRMELENLKYLPSLESPDQMAVDVTMTEFLPSGNPQARLLAHRLFHYTDGRVKANDVRLYTLDSSRAPISLVADEVRSDDGLESLVLAGNVQGRQKAFKGGSPLAFNTEKMTVWLDTYELSSQSPSQLIWGVNKTQSKGGFTYDHIRRTVTMTGNVTATLIPQSLKKKTP